MLSFLITLIMVVALWIAIPSSSKEAKKNHPTTKKKKKKGGFWGVDMRDYYRKMGLPM